MARLTVAQIMQSISGTVNQDVTTAPTAGSSEWQLWLEFINRAIYEWAESGDWDETRKVFYPSVTGLSQATMALPQDFKKVAQAPRLYLYASGIESGYNYPEALLEDRQKFKLADNYYYLLGNQSDGYNMVFHPGTLASGASVEVWYYSFPTSLASPAQVLPVPDTQYIIDRTVGFIFEARSDPRFQQQEVKAREKLVQMIENQNVGRFASYSNQQYVANAPLAKRGFRVGRD